MIRFNEAILELNSLRRQFLNNPKNGGFIPNKQGVLQKTILMKVAIRTNNKIQSIGQGLVCYSDENEKNQTPAGQLIRNKKINPYEVGQLWVYIKNKITPLAIIDPDGKARALKGGLITEDGQIIIDEEKT